MFRTTHTENGVVQGYPAADPRITAFKGIPYAAPPIGDNRWRAPQPCSNWDSVLLAQEFAPISVQDAPGIGDTLYNREWHVDSAIPMNEDCLYLNIWTNASSPDEKLPVVIWFFGGALQWGYPSEMEFDGERIARRGVVVVTVNYRLNVFGFLTHPQLQKEAPDAFANFGCLDQQFALQWVVRNIAHFGGDPFNITLAGQSAGGGSVLSQWASPSNHGLFSRVIIESAMIRSPYGEPSIGTPIELCKAQELGEHFFCNYLHVNTLAEARSLDAIFIRDCYAEFAKTNPRMLTVLDHHFIYDDPLVLLRQGRLSPLPILCGNTADEFFSYIVASCDSEFVAKAQTIFNDSYLDFLNFDEAWQQSTQGQYAAVNQIALTTRALLTTLQKEAPNCYYYQFEADIPGDDHPGTFHSVDLWFFFETLAKCSRPFKGIHYDLSRQMCNYWTNFIKCGDPNGPDADGQPMPEWYPYRNSQPNCMHFKTEGPVPDSQPETEYYQFLMSKINDALNGGYHDETSI